MAISAIVTNQGGAKAHTLGSDGPWLHPALELQKIRLLGLLREYEALVLGRNLLRLIQGAAARLREAAPPARRSS